MISVESEVWEGELGTTDTVKAWGKEIHRRLAMDSPVAVIRVRRVLGSDPDGSDVHVKYEFHVMNDLTIPKSLTIRGLPLRAHLSRIRQREGQFGGSQLPNDVDTQELSPPQVRGVQPLFITPRTLPDVNSATWGYSALRVSVVNTKLGAGVADPVISDQPQRLWWMGAMHRVQYVSGINEQEYQQLPVYFSRKSDREAYFPPCLCQACRKLNDCNGCCIMTRNGNS